MELYPLKHRDGLDIAQIDLLGTFSSFQTNGVSMFSMKTALIAGFAIAPLAFSAAHASDPDEFTLQPVIGGSSTSTVVYSPETYTTGSTVVTQPVVTGDGQFQDVDINDYIIQDTNTTNQ